jgi:hypothetical protein
VARRGCCGEEEKSELGREGEKTVFQMMRRQVIVRLITSPLHGVCQLENGICGERQKKAVQC